MKSSNKIKVLHKLKQSFKSIDIDIQESQSLMQGARYGLMVNGITTIYLPHNFRLNVGIGSELVASETLIGYFMDGKK
jgi:phosphatidylserine decarboxylase